ncbi:hypothetical protein [Solwaraspora sp. WMMA2065]|uniref:hypothetical protein n=1 Tax=Solwaraspora sp. WMMA2065 TaxID=3015166 RepID=UPI00259BA997|nr:hypothetical protein [Solwaraspora sp. WMMA2065]WJK33054.1 hypothetical protein O7610_20325 [Solwaraspora sp. WMMA2065]
MTTSDAGLLVLGRNPGAGAGEVIGIFEILDVDLRVIATGTLLNGSTTPTEPLHAGRYIVRAGLLDGRRVSAPIELVPGEEPALAVIDITATGEDPPSGDGWIAGWVFDREFTPAPATRLIMPSDTTVAVAGDRIGDGGAVVIQWTVSPQLPQFTVAAAGLPLRFVGDRSGIGLVPASGHARALLTFLQVGDLPAAQILAAQVRGGAPDPATAIAVGYILLRCGDPGLSGWARDLVAAQPRSFDAHLIHASALMRDPQGWPMARTTLLAATQLGLPLIPAGLRLLDDALRLLIQGTDDAELAAARQRFVPYLRVGVTGLLTTFRGTAPNAPTAEPVRARRPEHTRRLVLDRLIPSLQPLRPRPAPKQTASSTMEVGDRKRVLLGPYELPLVPAGPGAATLTLPLEFIAAVGPDSVGSVGLSTGQLIVMIFNITVPEDLDIRVTPEGSSESVALTRRGTALMGAMSWPEAGLPAIIGLSGYDGRPPTDRPRALREPAHAGASGRRRALVEEAERLSGVEVGAADASARFGELAEQWLALRDTETDPDRVLWRRFVDARQRFDRRHSPRVEIDARPVTRSEQTGDLPGDALEGLSIQQAELRLQDLLERSGFRGQLWDTVSAAATSYCLATVTAWLTAMHVPRPCDLDRRARAQLEKPWAHADALRVAGQVASNAVAHFRDRRLARGGWRIEDGTSLVTELLDACAVALPHTLRTLATRRGPAPHGSRLRRPDDGDPVPQSAAILRAAGYSRAEVAEVLGLSGPDAVTRAVKRYRRSQDV